MIRNISVILLVLIGIAAFSICLLSADITKEEFHNTYKVAIGTKLEVSNRNGSINISKWDEDYVDVYALKKTSYGEKELEKVEIEVNTDADMVIKTNYLEKNAKVSVEYKIKVPANIIVDKVKSSNGRIELAGTTGDSILNTSNGEIVVNNVNGSINAETSNGRIDIRGTTGIERAKSSNGSIKAEIPNINKDINIKTSNGSIEVHIPSDLNADIEMKTSNGKISLHDIQILASEISKTHVKGKIGNGGNTIYLETSNGSINLYKL